jgi:hypothetical protein
LDTDCRLDVDLLRGLIGGEFCVHDGQRDISTGNSFVGYRSVYAVGTAVGGGLAPLLFGELIASGSMWTVAAGYLAAAALMLVGAVAELRVGVDAEGKSLESVADPLSG